MHDGASEKKTRGTVVLATVKGMFTTSGKTS